MKNIIRSTAIMIALLVSVQFTVKAAAPEEQVTPTAVSYETFYDALSPYGTWIDYPEYGHVWHPDVADFRPYATNGYWEFIDGPMYLDGEWYWDSGYEWGWAPFHYGTWFYDDAYGWLWEPGYSWSPAWVEWGVAGEDYFAWAPVTPVGIERHGYEWNMVPRRNFYDHDLHASLVSSNRMMSEALKIKPVLEGPGVKEIEDASGHVVMLKQLYDVSSPAMLTAHKIKNVPAQRAGKYLGTAGRSIDNRVYTYRPEISLQDKYIGRQVQWRKAAPENIRPARRGGAWPSGNYEKHTYNIKRMPIETGRFMERGKRR